MKLSISWDALIITEPKIIIKWLRQSPASGEKKANEKVEGLIGIVGTSQFHFYRVKYDVFASLSHKYTCTWSLMMLFSAPTYHDRDRIFVSGSLSVYFECPSLDKSSVLLMHVFCHAALKVTEFNWSFSCCSIENKSSSFECAWGEM